VRFWQEPFAGDEGVGYETIYHRGRQPRGARPALLVVDVTMAFCGAPGLTLVDAVKQFPTACGPAAWQAMPHIRALIDAARAAGATIVYTTPTPGAERAFGGTVKGEQGPKGSPVSLPGANDIPAEIRPSEADLVLAKPKASAFFATPLLAHLHRHQVDSLIVCGATTSGCVRATVVDGFSWGYPVVVPEECVFDRAALSNSVSLFEMDAKYADVLTLTETTAWLASHARGAQA
jgi:nicotinamidase-related amidase